MPHYFLQIKKALKGMEKKLLFKKTLWHIMRLTFVQMILMAVFCTMAYAHDTAAQEILNKGVSIKAQTQSLKTILAQIEKQTNARFVYSDTRIPIDKQVFVEVSNQKLALVLNDLLPPSVSATKCRVITSF